MDDPELLERLAESERRIIAGVDACIPSWVVANVARIIDAWGRFDADQAARVMAEADELAADVAERVASELRNLFATDVEAQRSTPLQIVRSAYREPTELLAHQGIPGVLRDAFDERAAPDDHYDLSPRALGDLGDPDLGPALLAWGMAKSRLVRSRRNPAE